MSKQDSRLLTELLLARYPQQVTIYLPKHYIENDDTGREFLGLGAKSEIQGWVEDCMIDEEFEEPADLAIAVEEKMFNNYYCK